jgi:hypothetical protein
MGTEIDLKVRIPVRQHEVRVRLVVLHSLFRRSLRLLLAADRYRIVLYGKILPFKRPHSSSSLEIRLGTRLSSFWHSELRFGSNLSLKIRQFQSKKKNILFFSMVLASVLCSLGRSLVVDKR